MSFEGREGVSEFSKKEKNFEKKFFENCFFPLFVRGLNGGRREREGGRVQIVDFDRAT